MLFAGRELAKKIIYLKKQGKELDISINYPQKLEFLVSLYIMLFGIPEIGYQERFDFFQRCIKDLRGKTFVDAGCGNGSYSRFMADLFPEREILAFDNEKKLILLAKKLSFKKNIKFIINDLSKKNTKIPKADIVWSLDVLEHIKDYKKAIINLGLMVKKGGYLILHVPLLNQKRWFTYFKNWQHETHAREGFQKKEIINSLRNFKLIKEIDTFGLYGSFIWELNLVLFRIFPLIASMLFPLLRIAMLLDKIIPSKKYNAFGILAKKI